ncbi:ATP-binding protein [Crenobacter sp. SG2303]|uniref:histidine kinase n=1 Tax=Crenobacter oryzisoli TaxID=3056844 RepID=A0ABT7XPS9_9NEIS|nr:ATP-binding protein [Crenobacter sp. SG2303]MDN0075802.1 ATP-binding protein [Crenobacter sp. SG2303]
MRIPYASVNQTRSIGRAVIGIVVGLCIILVLIFGILLSDSFKQHRLVARLEQLNQSSSLLYTAADLIQQENTQTRVLLSREVAPSAKELAHLEALQQRNASILRLGLARIDAAELREAGAKVSQAVDNLQRVRQEVDLALAARPFRREEALGFGYSLAVAHLLDSVDSLLVESTFLLGDQSSAAMTRLTVTKLNAWALSRSLRSEGGALQIRAELARQLNSTEESQLLALRERDELLLERLRLVTQVIRDDALQRRLIDTASLANQLHNASESQLTRLAQPGVVLSAAERQAAIGLNTRLQAEARELFREVASISEIQTEDSIRHYHNELLRTLALAGITALLLAALMYVLSRRVMRPLYFLQRLLDSTDEAIFAIRNDRQILMVNQGAARMFGLAVDDMIHQDISRFLDLGDSSQEPELTPLLLRRHDQVAGWGPDGTTFHASITASPVESETGEALTLLVVRNENKRRQAELSLEHNLALLSSISQIENMLLERAARSEVFAALLDTLVRFSQAETGCLIGPAPASEGGSQVLAGALPEYAGLHGQALVDLPQVIASLPGWISWPIERAGELKAYIVLYRPRVTDIAALLHVFASTLGYYEEEDKRKISEQQLLGVLRDEEAIYRASPVGLLRLDADFTICRANEAAAKLFGLSEESMVGHSLYKLFADDAEWEAFRDALIVARDNREETHGEWRCLKRSGESIWVQLDGCPIENNGLLLACLDTTERKAVEIALRRARDQADQANNAKSAFLATMSHEIRTPMNGVLGMLELLEGSSLDAEQQDTVATIQESAQTLLRLIDDILDFSKIEASKLDINREPVDLRTLIEQVVSLYRETASKGGLYLQRWVAPEVAATVEADPLRIRQILQNFLSNAIKFTPQGTISVRLTAAGPIQDAHQVLIFEVHDNGIGMSPENMARLFEPFTQAESTTTRRFGGSGLGLAICRRLAELMGGQVVLESELGKGTIARLQIPVRIMDEQAAVQRDALEKPLQAAAVNVLPILFVEDNPTNRKLTLKQLQKLGYRADWAENGVEALQKWQRGRYGLILTDCHMPEMDGYQLAREVRHLEQLRGMDRTPIIACTANAGKEEAMRTQAAGMDDFLTKPLGLMVLSAALGRWLSGNGAERPAPPAPSSESPALAEPTVPPLDQAMLAVYSEGDLAVEKDILRDFLTSNDDDVEGLRQALRQQDAEQMAWFAHRIKGASRMVGAGALGQSAEVLEKVGKAGTLASGQEQEAFFTELGRLDAWLTQCYGELRSE